MACKARGRAMEMVIVVVTTGPCVPQATMRIAQQTGDAAPGKRGNRSLGARRRRAGNAPQRLRFPPRSQDQLHPRIDRSLRSRKHDREVRASRGSAHQRHGPAGPAAAGTATPRNHRCRRHAARAIPRSQDLRPAHADQSRVLASPGDRAGADDHPGHGPAHAAGQGPAGLDRRSAPQRQDDHAAAHQPRHFHELSGREADRAA